MTMKGTPMPFVVPVAPYGHPSPGSKASPAATSGTAPGHQSVLEMLLLQVGAEAPNGPLASGAQHCRSQARPSAPKPCQAFSYQVLLTGLGPAISCSNVAAGKILVDRDTHVAVSDDGEVLDLGKAGPPMKLLFPVQRRGHGHGHGRGRGHGHGLHVDRMNATNQPTGDEDRVWDTSVWQTNGLDGTSEGRTCFTKSSTRSFGADKVIGARRGIGGQEGLRAHVTRITRVCPKILLFPSSSHKNKEVVASRHRQQWAHSSRVPFFQGAGVCHCLEEGSPTVCEREICPKDLGTTDSGVVRDFQGIFKDLGGSSPSCKLFKGYYPKWTVATLAELGLCQVPPHYHHHPGKPHHLVMTPPPLQ